MPGHTQNRFLLLYGSQTGQAKAISEEICERAEKEGLHAEMHCLSQTEKKFNIEKERCVVIVTSTTGDGEPPDTACKFVRRLKKKTLTEDHLAGLHYTLLGLGDSNYTNFCNCGKTLDRRLEDLGAVRFYNSGWADDAVGLEVVVEPWIDGLWAALRTFLDLPEPDNSERSEVVPCCENSDNTSSLSGNTRNIQSSRSQNGNTSLESTESQVSSATDLSRETTVTDSVKALSLNDNENNRIKSCNTPSHTPEVLIIDQTNSLNNRDKENSLALQNGTEPSAQSVSIEKQTVTSTPDLKQGDSSVPTCVPSLCVSVPPLCESGLSVPALPPSFLAITYMPENTLDTSLLPMQNGCKFPSASSDVSMVTVEDAQVLTSADAVKKTLLLSLNTEDSGLTYEPGDAVSIVCPNDPQEVDKLLDRLGHTSNADTTIELSVVPGTKKKNAAVPPHIPPVCTLRHIFLTCVDIRDQPKKALLRIFVECTSDESEHRRLQELCSKQGAGDYSRFIRESRLSLLDVLTAFPSCQPPVERVIEQLPRLQPRPYSVCSSPQTHPNRLSIAFNIVCIPATDGRSAPRKGVCTGWLDTVTMTTQIQDGCQEKEGNNLKIPIFTRTNQHFRCPEDISVPIILIGPGTGVAPFIGFLQHRAWQRSQSEADKSYGQTCLFYGCRHQDRDYLFRKELQEFQESGVLSHLFVSFSRDIQPEGSPRYVQDQLLKQGELTLDLIEKQDAVVYVCGDARNMAKDVTNTFVQILKEYRGMSAADASGYLMKMRLHKKYLEDVWT
ncbi:methionine synthase reductase-like [Haliotis rubra]|uniref:methionine synthase reductase-like n=1 Tax=Haliotis rubra TaxID=36100 RepID=UPI001EE5776E|nr:methionine synthase reductase-like [Haliotis rubra]